MIYKIAMTLNIFGVLMLVAVAIHTGMTNPDPRIGIVRMGIVLAIFILPQIPMMLYQLWRRK